MKILDVTGKTEVKELQVETSAMKLGIILTGAANVMTEVAAIEVEANIHTPAGPLTNIYKMPLLTLLEMAGANQGFVKVDEAAKTIHATIELSNSGALPFGEMAMYLSFMNLTAGGRLQVYALDSIDQTLDVIIYEPQHFNAGVPKELDVTRFYGLVLPKQKLDHLELKQVGMHGERTIKYDVPELQILTDEINELSFLTRAADFGGNAVFSVLPGSRENFTLPISNVLTAKISLNNDGKVYLMRNETINL